MPKLNLLWIPIAMRTVVLMHSFTHCVAIYSLHRSVIISLALGEEPCTVAHIVIVF